MTQQTPQPNTLDSDVLGDTSAGAVAAPLDATETTAEAHTPETAQEAPETSTDSAVVKINDAVIIGTSTPAMDALLNAPATLMLGEMWEQRDKRNTQDGHWNPITMTWAQWISGGPGDKNSPAWGLSRHTESKQKEGHAIVFGTSIGKARQAKSMETMFAIGLDIDSGTPREKVKEQILKRGLLCIIYTSFNNGKQGLHLNRDDVLQKLKMSTDPTLADIRRYLTQFGKDRYDAEFLAAITIKTAKKQVKSGVVIVLDTPKLEKYRLVFPLAKAVIITELDAPTHQKQMELWAAKLTGLAMELGANHDTSATDPSRLFFVPKHAKDSTDFAIEIIQGEPLRFEDIKPVTKAEHRNRDNPYLAGGTGGGEGESDLPPQVTTENDLNLNKWHRRYKSRLMLADLLEAHAPDKLRLTGSESSGMVTIECPFEHKHTKHGGSGTIAINALDSTENVWTVKCQHDSCADLWKGEHLAEMLDRGWFEQKYITDIEEGYLLPPSDQDIEDDADEAEDEIVIEEDTPDATDSMGKPKKPQAKPKISGADVAKRFKRMVREAPSINTKADAIRDAVADSGFPQRTVTKFWDDADANHLASQERAETERREGLKSPDYIPLDQATSATVNAAADAGKWLPSFIKYKNGWFYIRAMDSTSPDKRLCRAFELPYIAFGENAEGRSVNITIRYQHRSKQFGIVESVFQAGDVYKEAGTFLGRLINDGFEIDGRNSDTAALVTLFKCVNTSAEALLVDKAGWHGDAYIAPTGEAVNVGKQRYILKPGKRLNNAKQGTVADHHLHATTVLTGLNGKFFLPGYLTGLVGCVVDFIANETSIIITTQGPSSRGKTSCGKAGVAHWTIPDVSGLFQKADATAYSVEQHAVRANGSGLALDDEGTAKITGDEMQRLILQWADGSGKSRGNAEGGLRETNAWNTCFFTSTEVDFLSRMRAEDSDVKTGAVARVFTVNFDGAVKLDPESAELESMRILTNFDSSTGIYGVTGPLFAAELARLGRDKVKARVKSLEAVWASLALGAGTRVVRNAAIITVAGEIAQEIGFFGDVVKVRAMMHEMLVETLDSRMAYLDTEEQSLNTLRRMMKRGLQMKTIIAVDADREFDRSEVFGYYEAQNGIDRPDYAQRVADDVRLDADTKLYEAAKKQATTDTTNRRGTQTPEQEAESKRKKAELEQWGADIAQRKEANAQRKLVYILPVDRMGLLGAVGDYKSIAKRLDAAGALIKRKAGKSRAPGLWHDHIPGKNEGAGKCLRITGAFVHGEEEAADNVEEIKPKDHKADIETEIGLAA